jgi:hypothetical protein
MSVRPVVNREPTAAPAHLAMLDEEYREEA